MKAGCIASFVSIAFGVMLMPFVCYAHGSGAVFRENKGQWEKHILYKAELKNGALFYEKNQITLNLFDVRDILRIKGDHHRLTTFQPQIDYTIRFHALRLTFLHANTNSFSQAAKPIKEYFNYFIGNDPGRWAAGVKGYREVATANLYDRISFMASFENGQLKYVYAVAPGGDAQKIQLRIEGASSLRLEEGNLIIQTSVGDIMDTKPVAHQYAHGKIREVPCRFVLRGNVLSFEFPDGYSRSDTLYIDPTLIFSTYSGSTADNFGYSATYDSKGNAYGAGSVFGVGYPVTIGAYQMNYVGGPTITFTSGGTYPGDDIGITKYSADGTQRIYSTYLGGYGQDLPHSLVVNANDELYVLGTTSCSDFPVTATAYDTSYNGGNDPGVFDGIAAHYRNGSDIIISRFSADGTQLLASTYIGGTDNDGLNYRAGQSYSTPGFTRHNYADEVRGEIDIDKNNNVYVASCTRSADFPRTPGVFQSAFGGGLDACIFKFDADLTTLIWCVTMGGSEDDASYSVAIDAEDNLYVAGGTRSTDFPITGNTYQVAYGGGETDGFVAHIHKNGHTLLRSTYYGYGDYDQIYFVELDRGSNVFVFGQADNSGTNYIFNASYNKPNGGQFITKFMPQLDSIIWSTSFGRGLGVTDISPTAFLVDVCNSVYACGWGSQSVNNFVGGSGGTSGLDVTPNAFKPTTDGRDFYLMVLRDDASQLIYATFMGGNISEEHVDGGTSRFDRKGIVYQSVCAGCGGNDDFPTTPGVVSNTNNSSNCNNAVFKFDLDLPLCLADFTAPNACVNIPVSFTNQTTGTGALDYQWFFGDGATSVLVNPTHIYTQPGLYDVTLIASDPTSCNGSDTVVKKILVLGGSAPSQLPDITICSAQTVQIGIPPGSDTTITYQWTPAATLSNPNISNPYATPQETTTYTLYVSNGVCVDSVTQKVIVFTDALTLTGNNVLCPRDTLQLTVTNSQPGQQLTYSWQPASEIITGANTATPLVSPSQNTTYTVTVTNQLGCTFVDSIQVTVTSALPGVSAYAQPDTIYPGDTTQLNLTLSNGVVSIAWTYDSTLSATNIPNPLAYPPATRPYLVEVTDSFGCKKRDTVIVYVIKRPCVDANIYIPNAFTPNGDGKNDVLYVRGNNLFKLYFAVYDRWGQMMFETRDINKGWDGTFRGSKLDPAVFGYYAEGECPNAEKFFKKGNVTLLR
ncbi:MAG: gliding motility-associated C-terminal domain-containing protein [Chitinophagales bacterium]|nr:gliding motility-associated C-terminal domain-containing protein [Chitinophagales bacterium]MDW8418369.1 gliding motility-associated C-terminal domain-containing protein [Chitinophagales bacterium]